LRLTGLSALGGKPIGGGSLGLAKPAGAPAPGVAAKPASVDEGWGSLSSGPGAAKGPGLGLSKTPVGGGLGLGLGGLGGGLGKPGGALGGLSALSKKPAEPAADKPAAPPTDEPEKP
jgi:hypothetical protein